MIDSIPSLPIHSSALIVLIAGLFLVALMIRARRVSVRQAARIAVPHRGISAASAQVLRRVRRWPGTRVRRRPRREPTTSVREDTHLIMSSSELPKTAVMHSSATQRFTVHWGRTLLALALFGSFAGALVTAVLAMTGILGWIVPGVCAIVMTVSLVSLQITARVRRRQRRRASVNEALQDAMNAQGSTTSVMRGSTEHRAGRNSEKVEAGAPFNALDRDAAGQGGPDSLIRHDEDGLADSAERVLGAEAAAQIKAGMEAAQQDSPSYQPPATGPQWAPESVPQPKYLLAEKVLRPEILPALAENAPSSQVKIQQPAAPAVDPELTEEHSRVKSEQSLNISDALKRRRA